MPSTFPCNPAKVHIHVNNLKMRIKDESYHVLACLHRNEFLGSHGKMRFNKGLSKR